MHLANKGYFNFSCLTMVDAVLYIILNISRERNLYLEGADILSQLNFRANCSLFFHVAYGRRFL